uniref:SUEL-type lectin domain-containing protein n=1 Tax=Poecilia latipinna TaxID=48699 RepID=A0A3B3VCM2_9TELE
MASVRKKERPHGALVRCDRQVSLLLKGNKVVCEEEQMRLKCKQGMQISVYSAMFGRTQQGTLECPPHDRRPPSVDCQAATALQVLTARCQGKKSCRVQASTKEFGDPCYAGTKKYLNVIYTCGEPRQHSSHFMFLPPGGNTCSLIKWEGYGMLARYLSSG